eukprot:CAMPEP_0203826960 /NCGR_PEP_ID=MMETSP0115-20131106/57789_1 /ASSEMBLY_ACC=CAM_ASM_000227 /TAXON_ID=33651 /ORGANISM="Bicosoecid sp, Strain ms1" /LENGTH=646 /DNA_ID=CAMNT_0050736015 /DNA_START=54 /DNA_END=1994 /DNA_ORIENTATION=+
MGRHHSTSSARHLSGERTRTASREILQAPVPRPDEEAQHLCLFAAYMLSSLSLAVTSWRFNEQGGKQYVEYQIDVTAKDELGDVHAWTVYHRFMSFRELHKQVRPYGRLTQTPLFERGVPSNDVPSPAVAALLGATWRSSRPPPRDFPELPDAHALFKTRDDQFRTERQLALDRYLRALVEQGPAVSRSQPLLQFIEADRQSWVLPLRPAGGLLAEMALYHEGGLLSRALIQHLLSRLEPAVQNAVLSVMTHTGLAIPVGRPSTSRHGFRGPSSFSRSARSSTGGLTSSERFPSSDRRSSLSSVDSSAVTSASDREAAAIGAAGSGAATGATSSHGAHESSPSASGGARSGDSAGAAPNRCLHFLVPSMIAPANKAQDSALAASWAGGDGTAPRMGRLFELTACPPILFERLIARWLQRRGDVLTMCYREDCLIAELPVAHGAGDDREIVMVMANLSLDVAVSDGAGPAPVGGDPVLDARARARAGMGMDGGLAPGAGSPSPAASVMVLAWMEEGGGASVPLGGHFVEPSWFGFLSMVDACRRIFDEVIAEEWCVFKYGSQLLQLSLADAFANSGWYNGTNVLPFEEVEQHSDTPRMVAEFFLTERQRAWRRGSDASVYDMRGDSSELSNTLREHSGDRFHLVRLK